ncbi:MAG: arginine deiminase family protein [Chryseolinea sp.]
MKLTCHSEVGALRSTYIKRAEDAFVDDATVSLEWKALNFLGKPDLDKSLIQYKGFENLLKTMGNEIHYFSSDSSVSMDSIYCRDASIATNAGVILCTMGKPARVNEPVACKKVFERSGVKILGSVIGPGTLEGGDVAWLDENTLAVGHTYRTNEEGIRQLQVLLSPLNVNVIPVPLPHYKGSSDVFHLMSILSPVDHDLAVVYSPLMPIVFRNDLKKRGYSFVEVPQSEFDSMGCNVLAIAPRICVMVEGNPLTKKALEDAGCTVYEYQGSEISVKGGGGPTCLTRPISRLV